MKFKSALVTQVSGSVGGATFAHNRGGMYMRSRSIPTNPNTTRQAEQRAELAALSTLWKTLSASVRAGYDAYAANTPIIDSLGNTIYNSGFSWFIAINSLRQLAGITDPTAFPTTPGLAVFNLPTSLGYTAASEAIGGGLVADPWTSQDDGRLVFQTSRGLSAGVNSTNWPLRFADVLSGSAMTPPTTISGVTGAFDVTAGQKVLVRMCVIDEEGRPSQPQKVLLTAA